MRIREFVELLDRDGWIPVISQPDLRQFRRRGLRARITIGGELDDELTAAQAAALRKEARLEGGA